MRPGVLFFIAVGVIACGKVPDLGTPCLVRRTDQGGAVLWDADGRYDYVAPGTRPGIALECSTRMCTRSAGVTATPGIEPWEPALGACSMQCSSDGDCTPQVPVIYWDGGRGPVAGRCALPRLLPGVEVPYETKYCFYGGAAP